MSNDAIQTFDISNNIRTFDTSFNEGVTSVVIEVCGARGANSSTKTGGCGAFINATIDDINPYPSNTRPIMYIELGVRFRFGS